MIILKPKKVLTYGLEYAGHPYCDFSTLDKKRYRSAYGIGAIALSKVIADLQSEQILGESKVETINIKHLHMALAWLKQYPTESNHAGHWKTCEKTAEAKTWEYVIAIRKLLNHKVVFPDISNPETPDVSFFCSVDGTHCRISEPRNDPDKGWQSHKNKKPGLAYEIALSIYEDKLIWINGPFKASVHDLAIFQDPGGLEEKIPNGKRVIADNAYSASAVTSTKNPLDSRAVKQLKKRARARHEIFNKRIKDFKILSDRFRSTRGSAKYGFKDQLEKHECVFKACCVLVQYDVDEECPLIKV